MTGRESVKTWATAVSKHATNGRAIIFRYAMELDPGVAKASQPVRVILVWKYESESGMPIHEERERMDIMEDKLSERLGEGNFATLSLVSTGENLREWTYYVKSEDEFMERLNHALAGEPAFPIEIHIAHDPEWTTYEKFRSNVAGQH